MENFQKKRKSKRRRRRERRIAFLLSEREDLQSARLTMQLVLMIELVHAWRGAAS